MSDLSEAVSLYYEKKYAEALAALERSHPAYKVHYGYFELMGSVYGGLQDPQACDTYFEKALGTSPSPAAVLNNWGIAKEKMDDWMGAEALYQKAIQTDPDYAHAYHNLATCYIREGKHTRARQVVDQMIQKFPRYALGYLASGNLEKSTGHLPQALAAYHQAIQLNPKILEPFLNTFVICAELGRYEEAEQTCKLALEHHPGHEDVLLKLGFLYKKKKQFSQAVAIFSDISEKNPACCTAYEQMANCLYYLEDYTGSIQAITRMVEHNPQHQTAEMFVQIADAYLKMNNPEQAEKFYHQAQHINPDSEMLKNNYALFLIETQKKTEPQFSPDHDRGLYNQALVALRTARTEDALQSAWKGYEKRWVVDPLPEHPVMENRFPVPLWKKNPLSGELLVWGEQGIGDWVFFSRLIPQLVADGVSVVLCVDPRLRPIVERSFPANRVRIWDPNTPWDPRIVAHIPIGSLCQYYAYPPFSDTVAPYLQADPDAVAYFRKKCQRYKQAHQSRKIIGFSWKTHNSQTALRRNIPLPSWKSLLAHPDVTWVNVQYGLITAEENNQLQQTRLMPAHVDPVGDLDLFLSLLMALDGVVCIDNATAHFAGAGGVPTAVLIPGYSDWKWSIGGYNGGTGAWYPTVRVHTGMDHQGTDRGTQLLAAGWQDLWNRI